jgi:hypothetical protein
MRCEKANAPIATANRIAAAVIERPLRATPSAIAASSESVWRRASAMR